MADQDLEDLLRRLAQGNPQQADLSNYAETQPAGLLASIGRILDYPRRKLAEAATGEPEASGRTILHQLGILGQGEEGFLPSLLGFGTEVATDPLTYLGGIGTLTKGGRAAKALSKIAPELKLATELQKTATTAEEATRAADLIGQLTKAKAIHEATAAAEGVAPTLAETLGNQVRAGQRGGLHFGIPFTDIGANVPLPAKLFDVVGGAGRYVAESSPGELIQKLFNPNYGTTEEGRAAMRLRDIEARAGTMEEGRYALQKEQELADLGKRLNLEPRDIEDKFRQVRESLSPEGVQQGTITRFGVAKEMAAARAEQRAVEEAAVQARAARQAEVVQPIEERLKQKLLETAAPRIQAAERLGAAGQRIQKSGFSEVERLLNQAKQIEPELGAAPLSAVAQQGQAEAKILAEMELKNKLAGMTAAKLGKIAPLEARAKTLAEIGQLGKSGRAVIKGIFLEKEIPAEARALIAQHAEALPGILEKGGNAARIAAETALRGKLAAIKEQAQALEKATIAKSGQPLLKSMLLEREVTEKSKALLRQHAEELPKALKRAGVIPEEQFIGQRNIAQNLFEQELQAKIGPRLAAAQEAERFLKEAPHVQVKPWQQVGALEPLAQELGQHGEQLLQRQIAVGARAEGSRLDNDIMQYAERHLTREAQEVVRKNGEEGFIQAMRRPLTTKEGTQIARAEPLRDIFTTNAETYFADKGFKGPYFETNIGRSVGQSGAQKAESIANARMAQALINTTMRNHVEGLTVPISRTAAEIKLHKLGNLTLPVGEEAIQRTLQAAGFGEKGVPIAVHNELTNFMRKVSNPEEIQKIGRALDYVTGKYAKLLTRWFPGFYFRNFQEDTARMLLNEGVNFKLLLPTIRDLMSNPQKLAEWERLGVINNGTQLKYILNQIRGQVGNEPGRIQAAFTKYFPQMSQMATKAGEKVTWLQGFQENLSRAWYWESLKAKGLTDPEAHAALEKALFNYGKMTEFEKKYASRILFFYPYLRKLPGAILPQISEHPNRLAFLTRATTQPSQESDVPLPEFIRQSAAVPLGKDQMGQPQFFFGGASPLDYLNRVDLTNKEGGLGGAAHTFFRKLGGQLVPPLRIPVELGTGQNLFYNKGIIESDRAPAILAQMPKGLQDLFGVVPQKMPDGSTRFHMDPYVAYAVNNLLPTSRAFREAGDVGNVLEQMFGGEGTTGRSAGQSLAQFLTGAKIASVPKREQIKAVLEQIDSRATELIREGKIGRAQDLYATGPKGEKDIQAQSLIKEQAAVRKLLKEMETAK